MKVQTGSPERPTASPQGTQTTEGAFQPNGLALDPEPRRDRPLRALVSSRRRQGVAGVTRPAGLGYLASVLAALCFAGCAPSASKTAGIVYSSTAAGDGLTVTLTLPRTVFVVGDRVTATITATNTTRRPIDIPADTGALVYVRIFRYMPVGWEEVKRYPQTATMVMSPWKLPPKAQRTFNLNLTVEPDWPAKEPLRMTAELNGRPKVTPVLIVRVLRQGDPKPPTRPASPAIE